MRIFAIIRIALVFLCLASVAQANAPEPIPHSSIAEGTKQVARAWLANPTDRYKHFVLGDEFEAASLVVEMSDGTLHQLDLPEHLVFEDRHVRLADINKDGRDEIMVVMSHAEKGAALAVFEADYQVALIAQTPFIGTPNRWLNPAGIADFDGDGRIEIALVKMPHLIKRLEFWRMDDGELEWVAFAEGFSNHRLGSRNLLMSVVYDMDKDGIDDLIIPGADYKKIHAISLFPENRKLKTWNLPMAVDGDFDLRIRKERDVVRARLISKKMHVISLN